jgi:hypothetical protein
MTETFVFTVLHDENINVTAYEEWRLLGCYDLWLL